MIKPKANPRTKAKIKIVSKRRKGGVHARVHPLPQPQETSSAITSRQLVPGYFNSPQQSNSKNSFSSSLYRLLQKKNNKVDIEPKQMGGVYGFKRIFSSSRKVAPAPSDLSPPQTRRTPPQTRRTPSPPQTRRTPPQTRRTPSPPRRQTPPQTRRTPSPPRPTHTLNKLAAVFSTRNQVVPIRQFGPQRTGKRTQVSSM